MKVRPTKLLIPLFCLICGGVILLSNITPVSAGDSACHVYLKARPGGMAPTTDTSQRSNCTSLSRKSGDAIRSLGSCNQVIPDQTTVYCREETPSISTASGKIAVYAEGSDYNLTFKNVTTGESDTAKLGSDYPTILNVTINEGDSYYFAMGWGNDFGTGWRAYDGDTSSSFFASVEEHATQNGYTIISEQVWADSLTESVYDSYDFDDTAIAVAVFNPAPKCENNKVSLAVSNAYLGRTANFTINTSAIASNAHYFPVNNSFSPDIKLTSNLNGSSCNPSTTNQTCYIQNRVSFEPATYTTPVEWTHNYQVCADSARNFCSEICTATTSFTVNPYPSYMKTSNGGTAHVTGAIKQSAFPSSQLFTSQLFSTSAAALTGYNPLANITGKSKLLGYNDINNKSNYYYYYSKKILGDSKLNVISTGDLTLTNTYLSTLAAKPDTNPVDVVNISGNLTVADSAGTIYCRKTTIFLVSGDLIFDNEFQIMPGKDTGCIFITAGNTQINLNDTGTRIDAFIISNDISTTIEGSVTIKGGVILQGENQTAAFNKNINANVVEANSIVYSSPSELVQYEGARYVNLFKDYLRNPIEFSIKEIQYVSN